MFLEVENYQLVPEPRIFEVYEWRTGDLDSKHTKNKALCANIK